MKPSSTQIKPSLPILYLFSFLEKIMCHPILMHPPNAYQLSSTTFQEECHHTSHHSTRSNLELGGREETISFDGQIKGNGHVLPEA